LTELIKPNILQQIQDAFSEYSGMASITTDAEGVPVTAGSNFTHFCTDLIRITEAGCKNCFNCDKMGAAQAMETGLPSVYTCHSGLVDFSAPIMLNGKMIGCFVGGQVLVGRIKGVERPPLAPLIPTLKGVSLLIDCGANVDARPSHLVQFARMGSIYMESVMGKKNPTVGIVNIGAEEEKGNALVKETFPLLKECSDINFIGSVEARDIPYGVADVIVCEAFAGNIILKLYEGVAGGLMKKVKEGMMSSLRSKIGALLVKPALKKVLKDFDTSNHGGAPLLGLNGLVVKTHGSSKSTEICNSIIQCVTFKEQKINEKIREAIQQEVVEEKEEK